MPASPHVTVRIDLSRVRRNAAAVKARVGVPVFAVVKADAYGFGAARVAAALADVVDGYCVFSLREAVEADLWRTTGKPAVALGPPEAHDPDAYLSARVTPAVYTAEQAKALRRARPAVNVDTGMQRFACPPGQVGAVIAAGDCPTAFTHATRVEQARQLVEATEGHAGLFRHAAGSALLDEPAARLDAVRPGLAIYRGAVRVSTPLLDVRDQTGPAGYGGFTSATGRHGVIPAGYSHGLRPGPCRVNRRESRVLEVGMQSAYVEAAVGDRAGDEVVLLGDVLTEERVAAAWGAPPQLVLVQLCGAGERQYVVPEE